MKYMNSINYKVKFKKVDLIKYKMGIVFKWEEY